MADIQAQANSTVIYLEGVNTFSGTLLSCRDHYHIDITLRDGRILRNVPHLRLARHIGWYLQNPSETVSPNSPSGTVQTSTSFFGK